MVRGIERHNKVQRSHTIANPAKHQPFPTPVILHHSHRAKKDVEDLGWMSGGERRGMVWVNKKYVGNVCALRSKLGRNEGFM